VVLLLGALPLPQSSSKLLFRSLPKNRTWKRPFSQSLGLIIFEERGKITDFMTCTLFLSEAQNFRQQFSNSCVQLFFIYGWGQRLFKSGKEKRYPLTLSNPIFCCHPFYCLHKGNITNTRTPWNDITSSRRLSNRWINKPDKSLWRGFDYLET
jgi:hypothetical protein